MFIRFKFNFPWQINQIMQIASNLRFADTIIMAYCKWIFFTSGMYEWHIHEWKDEECAHSNILKINNWNFISTFVDEKKLIFTEKSMLIQFHEQCWEKLVDKWIAVVQQKRLQESDWNWLKWKKSKSFSLDDEMFFFLSRILCLFFVYFFF